MTNRKPLARMLANSEQDKKLDYLIQIKEKENSNTAQEILEAWHQKEENKYIKEYIEEALDRHV